MKDERGFTLVETLMAIAAVALISGFLLQLFLVADHVQKQAYYREQAMIWAGGAMECVIGCDTPEDVAVTPLFLDCDVTYQGEDTILLLYADENWLPQEGEGEEQPRFRMEARLQLTDIVDMPLSLDGGPPYMRRGTLAAEVEVKDLHSGEVLASSSYKALKHMLAQEVWAE